MMADKNFTYLSRIQSQKLYNKWLNTKEKRLVFKVIN